MTVHLGELSVLGARSAVYIYETPFAVDSDSGVEVVKGTYVAARNWLGAGEGRPAPLTISWIEDTLYNGDDIGVALASISTHEHRAVGANCQALSVVHAVVSA